MKFFSHTALNKLAISFINAIEPANFSLGTGIKFAEQLNKTESFISLKYMKIFSYTPLNIYMKRGQLLRNKKLKNSMFSTIV